MPAHAERAARALTHPLFWVALLVLLVNDLLLKQAHLLPGAVTGKLSDFAGMLVAPVVLTALLRVRGQSGRMVACAAVAVLFSAIKLSRSLADILEAASAATPLPWRIWSDPTDLVALSMLPLGFWLCSRRGQAQAGARLLPYLRATGLVLGVFACAATQTAGIGYSGSAFLLNGTMRPQVVRLYRLHAPLDCSEPIVDPATRPGPDAFELRACLALDSRDVVVLDRAGGPADASVPGPSCDAVLLQADGLSPVVVAWSGVAPIFYSEEMLFGDQPNDEHVVMLEQAGQRLFIQGTSLLQVLPAGFDPAPADCPNGER